MSPEIDLAEAKAHIDRIRQLWHDRELELDKEAQEIMYTYPNKEQSDLASIFAEAIHGYETSERDELAIRSTHLAIARVEAHNLFKPGDGIFKKLREKDEQIASLEQRLVDTENGLEARIREFDELRDKYIESQAKLEDC